MKRRTARKTIGFALAFAAVFSAGSAWVWARPGEGIRWDNLLASPYLELRIFQDTNIFLANEDKQEDTAVAGQLGLRFLHETDRLRSRGHVYGYLEDYFDVNAADDEDFGGELEIATGSEETTLLEANVSYKQTDETDRELGSIQGRELYEAGTSISRNLTDKVNALLEYSWNQTDYDVDTFFDRQSHRVSGRAGYSLTDKTDVFVMAGYEHSSSDGSPDNEERIVRGGLRSQPYAKLAFDIGAGLRDSSETNLGELSYDAKVTWQATEKVAFIASGRNQVVPSSQEADNFNLQSLVDLTLTYDMTDRVRATLRGAYLRNELENKIGVDGVPTDKNSDTYTFGARVEYTAASKIYDLFAEFQYEERDSSLADEYEQIVAALGIILRY